MIKGSKKSINRDAGTATIVLIMADGTKFYRPFVEVAEADAVYWRLKELYPAANYLLRLGPLNLENDHVAIGQMFGTVTVRGGIAVESLETVPETGNKQIKRKPARRVRTSEATT